MHINERTTMNENTNKKKLYESENRSIILKSGTLSSSSVSLSELRIISRNEQEQAITPKLLGHVELYKYFKIN